jgi:hypothetical protein
MEGGEEAIWCGVTLSFEVEVATGSWVSVAARGWLARHMPAVVARLGPRKEKKGAGWAEPAKRPSSTSRGGGLGRTERREG